MPILSPVRAAVPLLPGIENIHRGKVRDTYDLGNGLLLVVCTDAISIFDFVLNALVPQKGQVLMAMSHFWFMRLHELGIRTHFVAAGEEARQYLPRHLRSNDDLLSRAMVVQRIKMHKVEFIGRVCLTGSGLTSYRASGSVCGLGLPKGLQDGDKLPYILDTPTTKADIGHDMPMDAEEVRRAYPEETMLLIRVVQILNETAMQRGNILADTKIEMGLDPKGYLTLGDEVGTPDSSRYWDLVEWQSSRLDPVRKAPAPKDKQLVRKWGIEVGINDSTQYKPENELDAARVHELVVPHELLERTSRVYREIFQQITQYSLEGYLEGRLGVRAIA